MYQALLSGATGALGLGGGSGGGVGTQQAAPSATEGDITSGAITPSISVLYGGGFKPNINISIPPPGTTKLGDVNSPLELFTGLNWLYIGLGLVILGVFFFIFKKG